MKNSEQKPKPHKTVVRQFAMKWWNGLSSLNKTQLCDTNTELVGSVRRWETLTGREVQFIYEAVHIVKTPEAELKNWI